MATVLDKKFNKAVDVFVATGRASPSLLQRRMGIGYTRAIQICEQMEAMGLVGADRGARGRELLITPTAWEYLKQRSSGQRLSLTDRDLGELVQLRQMLGRIAKVMGAKRNQSSVDVLKMLWDKVAMG